MRVLTRITRVLSREKASTTTNNSTGPILGRRVDSGLDAGPAACPASSAKHKERVSRTQFSGSQSTSLLTASRFAGEESSVWLGGTGHMGLW